MTDTVSTEIETRLAPYAGVLGGSREAYTNHALRVLAFCDALHERAGAPGPVPSTTEAYLTAAAFHDLGIWTDHTLDYLDPSAALAGRWLREHDRPELDAQVQTMVTEHHKLRRAGAAAEPVEIFRRADAIDASLGLARFGVPRAQYKQVASRYPNAGFHRELVRLAGRQLRAHPLRPAPMMKW